MASASCLETFDRLVLALVARRHGHARLAHQLLGRILQTHGLDAFGLGPDPDQPCIDHGLREIGVFRQEAVARMDRLGARVLRRLDDDIAAQIAFSGRRGSDMHRLVCLAYVQRLCIGIRIDRDGRHPHLAGSTDDAAGDFAAIGDEEL